MHYNVPQFIDIEDRIVGPLTTKQLLWLFGMAAVLFLLWLSFENKINFFLVGIPTSALFVALAFYRPYGQPLSKFIASMFLFFIRPKIYMWKRDGKQVDEKQVYKRDIIKKIASKKMPKQKEVFDISKILDSEPDILDEINKKL